MCLPENQCVSLHVQVALTGQKVQPEEAVIAPAFTNLKVRGKLPNDVLGWVAGGLMHHFHTIFIPAQRPGEHYITFRNAKAKDVAVFSVVPFVANLSNAKEGKRVKRQLKHTIWKAVFSIALSP